MNISRLGLASGSGFGMPRVGTSDVRRTPTPAPLPTRDGGTRVDGNPDPALATSPRLASFEASLQSRIDQMAASGKLSQRQLEALQNVKEDLSSMMARLDRAFFDGEKLDENAAGVLSHILDLTSESLASILGHAEAPGNGRTAGTNQHQFAYGQAASGVDVAGKSLDTLV